MTSELKSFNIDTVNRWMIALSVMLATVLEILDTTIVSIALPHMMGSFGATFDQITWVMTSYIVAAAVVMPITGFLINRFGSKKLLIINIIGFMLSSMMCGVATSLIQMVCFRVMQGVFGASLVPLSQFILRNSFPPDELTKAMAIWGIGIMAGPVLGPTIGGYITDTLNWRWIFYINVPICLVDVLLCLRYVPETEIHKIKTDILGILLLVISTGCLQIFLDRGNSVHWFDAASTRWLFVTFLLGFAWFIWHSLNVKDPAVDLKLFLNKNFSACSLMVMLFVAGAIGIISIQPLFLENFMNYPANYAGLVMAPRGIASAITMGFVPILSKKIEHRKLMFAGIIFAGTASYLFSLLNLDVSPGYFVGIGMVQGVGMGLFFVPLTTLVFATLPNKMYAEASGIFSFCRNLGMSIGISVIATSIARNTQVSWNSLVGNILHFSPSLQYNHIDLHDQIRIQQLAHQVTDQATTISFLNIYRAVAIAFVFMLPLTFLLVKSKRSSMPGEMH